MRDLRELRAHPIPCASAVPLETNIFEWHCNIVMPEGSDMAGFPIHFVLTFPKEYPNKAPNAGFSSKITYVSGASTVDALGRTTICLELFGDFQQYHSEWGSSYSGWSPSYTVSTILVALQATLTSGSYFSGVEEMRKSALQFKCSCGHCGSSPETYQPAVEVPNVSLKEGSGKEGSGKEEMDSFEEKMLEHFKCYGAGVSYDETIIGFGLSVTGKSYFCPCEYLSRDAFVDMKIRKSSVNETITRWIPLYINADHWTRAQNVIMDSIKDISLLTDATDAQKAFQVVCGLMNTAVVSVFNTKENPITSSRFLEGYFQFYRILLELAFTYPELVRHVDDIIGKFIESEEHRTKEACHNLGELLVYASISSKYAWKDLSKSFLDESDVRRVFWLVEGNRKNPPQCPELLDPEVSEGRLEKTFSASKTSRSLIAFQVRCLLYLGRHTLDEAKTILDRACAIPTEEVQEDLKNLGKSVAEMSN
jgi:ubiquitin-protein ligase